MIKMNNLEKSVYERGLLTPSFHTWFLGDRKRDQAAQEREFEWKRKRDKRDQTVGKAY